MSYGQSRFQGIQIKNFGANLLLISIILLLTSFASAQNTDFVPIETFSDYTVDITLLDGGNAQITHNITIKNNDSSNPIVPGIAYLNVFKDQEKNYVINDLEVTLADKTPIVKFLRDEEDYFEIRYELWFPLAPKNTTKVIISYVVENFYPEDALFYEINFPVGNSSIPIENTTINLHSSDKSISYAGGSTQSKDKFTWNLGALETGAVEKISFEFTSLPFPTLPVKGFLVFWSLITIIGLVIIVGAFALLRKAKKKKTRNEVGNLGFGG